MTRPIKFRVWDKDAKKMHPVGNITFDPELEVSVLNYNSDSFSVVPKYQPHLVLMQYTGLKDMNGREIYESDILRINETMDNRRILNLSVIAKVVWDEAYGQWRCHGEFDGSLSDYAIPDKDLDTPLTVMGNECKAIGNIYENPELLEEKL